MFFKCGPTMNFYLSIITHLLFASTAIAAVTPRNVRHFRNSQPAARLVTLAAETVADSVADSPAGNATHVIYSSNWAGAVLTAPPPGSTFTSVSAQFTVPSPSGNGAASAWVGIDGDTYTAAILQTGIDFTVANGALTYNAWYEWFPDYAYDFPKIKISPGDLVSMAVLASNPNTGIAVIENLTTGQKVASNLAAPTADSHLGGQNAEWIVEDFQQDGAQVPFANFGTITFTKTIASTSSHTIVDSTGAQILEIKQNNNVLTSSSATGSTITVSHK